MHRRGKGPTKKDNSPEPHCHDEDIDKGAMKVVDIPVADGTPKKSKRYEVVKVKRNYVNRNSMDMFNS